MKDHTPIKRHQALVSFSKDHHFGLLLVWKIRQGLDNAISTERICNYIQYFFKEDLAKHFKEEEEMLFSKLPADDSLRKQAEGEHQLIKNLVANMASKKPALPGQLADLLEKHIRFEERELFNHLQESMPIHDLEAITMRMSNNSKEIDDKWPDAFWQK